MNGSSGHSTGHDGSTSDGATSLEQLREGIRGDGTTAITLHIGWRGRGRLVVIVVVGIC